MKRLSILLVALLLAPAVDGQAPARPLDVYWIDVEGGGATLIVTPAGESVLIDTGYPGERGAPRIVEVATNAAGLTRIDHLIVTHFHIDHFGGAAEIAKLLPVGRVYDNGKPSPDASERDAPFLASYAEAFKTRRTLLSPGDAFRLTRGAGSAPLSLRLLGTRQQFVPARAGAPANTVACAAAAAKPDDTSDNANSTVWLLELGRFRFFDGGDLTWNTEARLVCPVNLAGQVDVYQTNHHGLDVSNNPVLLGSLAPAVAVMNNGPRKGTEPGSVAALKATASLQAIYQLHKNVRDGQNAAPDTHIANLDEKCAAGYIRMRVEPDGERYTIEIPATGHKQSFRTKPR